MLNRLFESQASFLSFRYIDFRRFIFSKFMLTLALRIQFVVLTWQVYQITHDKLSLGLVGLSEAIPAVGLALYGGYVADRKERRKILIIVMALQLITSVILMFISLKYDKHPEYVSALPFYAIMFTIGLLRSFYSPAQMPLMTQIIPREAYANSSAWNSTFWHIATVVGAAGGGIIFAILGTYYTYLVIVILLLIALIQMIRVSPQPLQKVLRDEGMLVSIKQGLRFVFAKQEIFGAMLLDLIAVLFGGATAMLPVFASDVLKVGKEGYGLLQAAPFIGSVAIALYMTQHPPLKNSGRKLLLCVSAFAVCMIFFALSKNFYLSMIILAISGAFDNVSVVIRSTILQLFTPDEMRGRVSSVSTMFISSSNEIGAFESGFAAKIFGLIPSIIGGGIIALTSTGITMAAMPRLRNLSLDDSVNSTK
jgi:MFS family permease